MRRFGIFVFIGIFGLHQLSQVSSDTKAAAPPKPKHLRDIIALKALSVPKQQSQLASQRKSLPAKPNLIRAQQEKPIQRRDVPFQQTFLGVPVQIEHVNGVQGAQGAGYPGLPKVPPPRPLIKPNETEAERAERIHKSIDRLLTFVEIVGQVDNYVSSKWKNLVKTVSNFYETEDEPYRVSAKRVYEPCPYAHAH